MNGRRYLQSRGFRRILVTALTFVMLVGVCVPGMRVRADEVKENTSTTSDPVTASVETPTDQNGGTGTVTGPVNTSTVGDNGTADPEMKGAQPPAQNGTDLNASTAVTPNTVSEDTESDAATKTEGADETTKTGPETEEIEHIDTCVEGCTGENCECECHSFYARLMACETIEEMNDIFDVMTDEDKLAIPEEKWQAIDAHYLDIEPEPAPAVVVGIVTDPPVLSEYATEGDVIDPADADMPR